MGRFADIDYWFTSIALSMQSVYVLLAVSIGFLVLALMLKLVHMSGDKVHHLYRALALRISRIMGYMGGILLMLTFFYYEGAFILSFKAWFALWAVILVALSIPVIKFYKKFPEYRVQSDDFARKAQYR
jgi:hypothetical protein